MIVIIILILVLILFIINKVKIENFDQFRSTTPRTCASLRTTYDILPGITFGTTPQNDQNWWYENCGAERTTCRELRDKYGIIPSQTFGTAPANVQNWWIVNCGAER
jgi:hypothetical protein